MISARHRATSGTTRWQHGVNGASDRGQPVHAPLSRGPCCTTSHSVNAPDIFDRTLRRQRRDRCFGAYPDHNFVRHFMLEGIYDRLSMVARPFSDVLDLGCFRGEFAAPPGARIARLDAGTRFAAAAGGVQGDEDRLPFADHSFDLVVSAGVLDSVNDLPGALVLARRVLRPDGLFLAAFVGGGSLSTLRACLREVEGERPIARLHPQVDVRAAGDLLMRAGFALPVADTETLTVRYRALSGLFGDQRGMGAANMLTSRWPLSRATLARISDAFTARADADGRTAERFEIVYLTGWAPDPSQPKPARRGSATTSLADALKPGGRPATSA
ncbi:MAG: SAM-dependent methyltransferase [Sphingomonas sp.]|nr:SAM-dependent methyltransferase [Sphingomonas sp.]